MTQKMVILNPLHWLLLVQLPMRRHHWAQRKRKKGPKTEKKAKSKPKKDRNSIYESSSSSDTDDSEHKTSSGSSSNSSSESDSFSDDSDNEGLMSSKYLWLKKKNSVADQIGLGMRLTADRMAVKSLDPFKDPLKQNVNEFVKCTMRR